MRRLMDMLGPPPPRGLLGMVLEPAEQAAAVARRAGGGDGAARVPQALPAALQPLPHAVHREHVHDADEVAALRPVDDVQRTLQVGQQAAVLDPEVRKLGGVPAWP